MVEGRRIVLAVDVRRAGDGVGSYSYLDLSAGLRDACGVGRNLPRRPGLRLCVPCHSLPFLWRTVGLDGRQWQEFGPVAVLAT